MLDSIPVALFVGTILGFLSGLGVGGGSLLILWLTMALQMEHSAARGINLLFFLPSAGIACLFRWRQGSLHFSKIFPAIVGGCLSAFLFSKVGMNLDLSVLKKLFGVLLLFTGVREVFYRPREKGGQDVKKR